MKLRVTARGVEYSGELREYVHRRAHFSLGRFAAKIQSVAVRLSDENGPRGGVDKSCDIRIHFGLRPAVIVRERQASMQAAVAFAMDRAERAVRRRLSLSKPGAVARGRQQ
ncbi:MAG TPA: HPF/RaiA family ribosome-associated protein [Bryobacteraceae bacterium]|nr:HPF/RaiA family ribosome-associated protein [Bryobacteraceae bacterium]